MPLALNSPQQRVNCGSWARSPRSGERAALAGIEANSTRPPQGQSAKASVSVTASAVWPAGFE
jgi:hypothetical protein